MSNSVRPHRRQPTRLPHPWDSPGKNTGVSCHFLLQCMKVKSESEVAQSSLTLCDPMDYSPPGSSAHGISQARVLEWGAKTLSSVKSLLLLWLSPASCWPFRVKKVLLSFSLLPSIPILPPLTEQGLSSERKEGELGRSCLTAAVVNWFCPPWNL